MPGWLKWTLGILAVLIVAIGAGYWWLIVEGSPPSNLAAETIDIAQVRALAGEFQGPKATEVRVETIASMSFPETAVVAGEGWDALPMGVFSYQLVFPDQTMIIDTAFDDAGAATLSATFHADAHLRMVNAMMQATQIAITHEHPDHIGGILTFPGKLFLRGRLQLTREQVATAGRYAGFTAPPGILASADPLEYEDYRAIAPGVVPIKAQGHSPGSQMIYVQRADGREFLFTGDIGWSLRNIEELRPRARLVSQFMLGEDRDAVFAQLAGIRDLRAAEPDIVIVPGHDLALVDSYKSDGLMVDGFSVPVSP